MCFLQRNRHWLLLCSCLREGLLWKFKLKLYWTAVKLWKAQTCLWHHKTEQQWQKRHHFKVYHLASQRRHCGFTIIINSRNGFSQAPPRHWSSVYKSFWIIFRDTVNRKWQKWSFYFFPQIKPPCNIKHCHFLNSKTKCRSLVL